MKRIAIALMFVCTLSITINAQQTELVINNAIPGKLTLEEENYSYVESLVLKGLYNAHDMAIIGNAYRNARLKPKRLDMEDVIMCGIDTYQDEELDCGMFTHSTFSGFQFLSIPTSIKTIKNLNLFRGEKVGSSYLPVDTVIFGSTTAYKYISLAHADCINIKNLVIRDGVESICLCNNASSTSDASSLESVHLPQSLKSIDSQAFYKHTNLQSVNIPDNIKRIGEYCFYGTKIHYSADTLYIPEHVKYYALNAYGTDLLYGEDGNVRVVYVPESLDTLETGGTLKNANVSFYFKAKTPPVISPWWWSSGESMQYCRIYVPKGCKEIYSSVYMCKAATIIELNPLETILLDKHAASIEIGETLRLIPTFIPSDADDKTLTWSVKNDDIAKVENGVVTALAPGKTWVYATSVVEDVKDSCEVTVIQHVTDITFDTPTVTLEGIGATAQLNVIVTPEDATDKTVNWTSSNPSVCVVSNGKIVAVGYGTSVVIATSVDGGHMAVATVKVDEAGEVTLTIQQSANGTVSTKVEKGSVHTFAIQAESGWKIHSITFNDVDVTGELDATNCYTTPTITENSTLYVTFEEDAATDVKATEASEIRVQGTSFGVRILNAANETVNIYTPDGVLVKTVKVTGTQMDVELPEGSVYLVKVAAKTLKVSR